RVVVDVVGEQQLDLEPRLEREAAGRDVHGLAQGVRVGGQARGGLGDAQRAGHRRTASATPSPTAVTVASSRSSATRRALSLRWPSTASRDQPLPDPPTAPLISALSTISIPPGRSSSMQRSTWLP